MLKKLFQSVLNYKSVPSFLVPDALKSQMRVAKFGIYEVVINEDEYSELNEIPSYIKAPSYAKGGEEDVPFEIDIKDSIQIDAIRQSCKLAKNVLDAAGNCVQVGVTTESIDEYVHNLIISNSAYPSPLNYMGFPKSICTSVNNVAVHGIPNSRRLKDGDIVSIDVTVYLNGFHGDCAATYLVGNVDEKGKRLTDVAKDVLLGAIDVCRPGAEFSFIGREAEKIAKKNNMCIIPSVCGHGIGRYFHELPIIDHVEHADNDDVMMPGMIFTIEPAVGQGSEMVEILEDNWTVVTEDDSRVAQFEHTVLITSNGVEILTL